MELAKTDLFKKFQNEIPIGLSALGLKKKKTNGSKLKMKGYPNFFHINKVSPVAN